LLDRVSAAVAVLVLSSSPISRGGTEHFNLGQGIVCTTVGIGASVSTTYAGYLRDNFGSPIVFLRLTAVAAFGFVAVRA
jgi:hypothetical protein